MIVPQFYRWQDGDLLLSVKLHSGAHRDESAGLRGTQIKVRIKAPPVAEKANEQLIARLAKLSAVPEAGITTVFGGPDLDRRVASCAPARLPYNVATECVKHAVPANDRCC